MNIAPVALYTGCQAKEGTKCVPLSLAFTTLANTQDVDLYVLQQNNNFSGVVALYVDNADNAADVIITMRGSNQRITAKANTQGYYAVLSVEANASIHFECSANITVPVQLLNFPVAPFVWSLA